VDAFVVLEVALGGEPLVAVLFGTLEGLEALVCVLVVDEGTLLEEKFLTSGARILWLLFLLLRMRMSSTEIFI